MRVLPAQYRHHGYTNQPYSSFETFHSAKHSTAFQCTEFLHKACSWVRLSCQPILCHTALVTHLLHATFILVCIMTTTGFQHTFLFPSRWRRTWQTPTASSRKHATAPSGISVKHLVRTVMTPSDLGRQRLCRNSPDLDLGWRTSSLSL